MPLNWFALFDVECVNYTITLEEEEELPLCSL